MKEWKLELPLHVEYRTFPMLFYVPPLLPISARSDGKLVTNDQDELFGEIEKARAVVNYMSSLFTGGNPGKLRYALRKQMAVRLWRRHKTVGDISEEVADRALTEADCTRSEAEAIYRLTSLPTAEERFVIPPSQREMAIEMVEDPHEHRSETGFGFRAGPQTVTFQV